MPITAVAAIATRSKAYGYYITTVSEWKDKQVKVEELPDLPIRKQIKEGDKVYYEVLPGEVICRLPMTKLNSKDKVVIDTDNICFHISDTTNNLRKHMKTKLHSYDHIGIKDGHGGGMENKDLESAAIFYFAFFKDMEYHKRVMALRETEQMVEEGNSGFLCPMSPDTEEALQEEQDRLPKLDLNDVTTSPPTVATSSSTSRKRPHPSTPDLWEIPKYTSGANKNKVNWTAVKNDLQKENRQYPCIWCKDKGFGKKKGNKTKSTRCNIIHDECKNYNHYRHPTEDEQAELERLEAEADAVAATKAKERRAANKGKGKKRKEDEEPEQSAEEELEVVDVD